MDNKFKRIFDWESFQKQFFSEGHWQEAMRNESGTAAWVDQYVQQLIADTLPKVSHNHTRSNSTHSTILTTEIFETHQSVIVRLKISPDVDIDSLRFFVGINELVIRGIPADENKKIKLPANVRHKGSKAVFKNDVFEVRMPKRKQMKLREIPTTWM